MLNKSQGLVRGRTVEVRSQVSILVLVSCFLIFQLTASIIKAAQESLAPLVEKAEEADFEIVIEDRAVTSELTERYLTSEEIFFWCIFFHFLTPSN